MSCLASEHLKLSEGAQHGPKFLLGIANGYYGTMVHMREVQP